jgi:peptidoglycan/xylan/chitin deacetylase (PgdA/CDA1 family)
MLTISNYHYIRNNFLASFPSIFGLTPELFENQLLLIKEIGTFIHPNDLIIHPDEILKSAQNYILVTFDDGLKEQFVLAKPILDRLNIPALFLVNSINFIEKKVSLVHKIHLLRSQIAPSKLLSIFEEVDLKFKITLTPLEQKKAINHYNYDNIESAHLKYILNFKLLEREQSELINGIFKLFFDENEVVERLYMNESELISLANYGMLGSHSHSHLALGILDVDTIREELYKTKKYLEQLTQNEIKFVSYPFGNEEACAKPVSDLALAVGYSIGFTMERGINTDKENKLLLKRFDCNDLPGGKNEIYFKNEYSIIYK